MTAASTIEPTDAEDRNGMDSWMVIETAEQGQLLLNLPGRLYRAMVQATELPAHQAGPGRLALTEDEITAYRANVARLTSVG
ncbi:hypothetical protein OIU91_40185 [Streptomyces sp. NBC_01456]|uniref:hypothetical protein n=1 Tax=unclassified Streptomyces TaxID=2593676 RepID=UPI002E364F0C|nr:MULTISPECIES: hypothetical protein [unclassified Streptomyces]